MPFLPTLAVAVMLAAASLLCPSPHGSAPAAPAPAVAAVAMPAAMPAPVAARAPEPEAAPRPPAALAFAAIYPLGAPVGTVATRAAGAARASMQVAARHPCPGRRCRDLAAAPMASPRAPEAGPGRARAAEEDGPPAAAIPFVGAIADTFAPAVRAVRRVAGTAADEAADLVRGGAASVKGPVALLAECLP